jgi:hypothetical protein
MEERMADDEATDDTEAFEQSLDHAWNWFSLHAGQRMQLINFFIVAAAFITAGYASTIAACQYSVSAAVAVGGVVVCLAFDRLDIRTRELVHIAEPALAKLEQRLIDRTGIPELNFVTLVDRPAKVASSYRFVVGAVTRTAASLFGAGFIYAIVRAW